MRQSFSTCIALLALTSIATSQSTTFVVDDSGGAGVNFTDIPSALSAANDGDVVLVQAGNYAGFTLIRGVRIIGHGVVQTGNVRIDSTTAGTTAVIAGMSVAQLDLVNCSGAVLFDDVVATDSGLNMAIAHDYIVATVTCCSDVRFHHCQIVAPSYTIGDQQGRNGLGVVDSRVELSRCVVRGGVAHTGYSCYIGLPGGTALSASGSRLDIALSDLRGGTGGDGDAFCSAEGGDGGHGLVLSNGSSAVVCGTASNAIRGAANGQPSLGIASPGYGAYLGSGTTMRWSGVQFFSGSSGIAAIAGATAGVIHAVPDDPTIDLASADVAGSTMSFTFNGIPGDWSRLQQGTAPIVVDDGLAAIERLDNRFRQHALGITPPSGVITYPILTPPNAAPGWLRIFQGYALDGTTGVLEQRTNSVFVIVR